LGMGEVADPFGVYERLRRVRSDTGKGRITLLLRLKNRLSG
jgi:hypothetical protein